MKGYNRVILIGNITRDPEIRYTPKGLAIGKFSLAINRTWKDANGQGQEDVTFVDVDCFGKTAEAIGQYLKKGSPIAMEGRLKLDQWQDKNSGQQRQKLGVVLESFTFIGGGQQQQGQPEQRRPAPKSQHSDNDGPPPEDGPPAESDDVPF